ncbi:MAG: hypothetical protein ACXADB_00150 [Candidatus Hermodarchaeia archaeon]|jgi:hypothetical protein
MRLISIPVDKSFSQLMREKIHFDAVEAGHRYFDINMSKLYFRPGEPDFRRVQLALIRLIMEIILEE